MNLKQSEEFHRYFRDDPGHEWQREYELNQFFVVWVLHRNLSGNHFWQIDLFAQIDQILASTGILGQSLKLEHQFSNGR